MNDFYMGALITFGACCLLGYSIHLTIFNPLKREARERQRHQEELTEFFDNMTGRLDIHIDIVIEEMKSITSYSQLRKRNRQLRKSLKKYKL